MIRATWYRLCNFKNVKNTYGGVLLLVKLQAKARNTPLWVFFTFFNYTNGTNRAKHHIC